MRLDPKYFNLFIAICAVLTLFVIVYGTISYSNTQATEFRKSIAEVQLDTLAFASYPAELDSVYVSDVKGSPAVIQFWSTWSGKSLHVNSFLESYQAEHPDLVIVAATVRDGEQQIIKHIQSSGAKFLFVEGTSFFQKLLVPGVPSQIIIDREGKLFDTQIGDDTVALGEKLDRLFDE